MAEVGFESALAFIGKVKEVYEAESSRYQGFLDALKDFKAGRWRHSTIPIVT